MSTWIVSEKQMLNSMDTCQGHLAQWRVRILMTTFLPAQPEFTDIRVRMSTYWPKILAFHFNTIQICERTICCQSTINRLISPFLYLCDWTLSASVSTVLFYHITAKLFRPGFLVHFFQKLFSNEGIYWTLY